jgi:hypothetical protein
MGFFSIGLVGWLPLLAGRLYQAVPGVQRHFFRHLHVGLGLSEKEKLPRANPEELF